ncbi:hypothetical protein GCM10010309_65460 [Streptomyces violaceochromogenes]|nr:hypothetical protein GCM10010309_65460 [Streptomyces violaceochromogenes]
MLCRLFIQQASNELARTPFCTGGTAVSSLFSFPAAHEVPGRLDEWRAHPFDRTRPGLRTHNGLILTQFLVQLHASSFSVDNSCGVNPRVGAAS